VVYRAYSERFPDETTIAGMELRVKTTDTTQKKVFTIVQRAAIQVHPAGDVTAVTEGENTFALENLSESHHARQLFASTCHAASSAKQANWGGCTDLKDLYATIVVLENHVSAAPGVIAEVQKLRAEFILPQSSKGKLLLGCGKPFFKKK
jgi:hypothetical protein